MFVPDDPLAPKSPVFDEAWHAQVLAIADAMVTAGRFSPVDWANALAAELLHAQAEGRPDTNDTYYAAALSALERLSEVHAGLTAPMLEARKAAWEDAYRNTPHGEPVTLSAVDNHG